MNDQCILHSCVAREGLLNPLACPHHMSQSEDAEFREGVVLNKPVKDGRGSFVNVGLAKEVQIDRQLDAGLRVTIKMKPSAEGNSRCCTKSLFSSVKLRLELLC